MSSLEESFEKFTVMDRATVSDGYGGTTQTYTKGVDIEGAMPLNMSSLTRIADAITGKAMYTLTVRKNVSLDIHTVLLRAKDGLYYRTTSGTDDKETPKSASLNMRQYTIESFKMEGSNG